MQKDTKGKALLYFLFLSCLGIVFYWVAMMLTHSANIDAYFHSVRTDTGMDYFNMMASLREKNPYDLNVQYPALCFLFWKIMRRLLKLPQEGDYGDSSYLRINSLVQLGYILFIVISLLIIWEIIRQSAKTKTIFQVMFSFALVLSGPMFYLLERGNILLISLVCTMLFMVCYDSPRTSIRFLSYCCLAVAAAIKIYPAIFGILVVRKKRYAETAELIVLGILTFLLPFLAFGGLNSALKMINSYFGFSGNVATLGLGYNFSIPNLVKIIAAMGGHIVTKTSGWLTLIVFAFCIFLFVVSRQEWQQLYALTLCCIWPFEFSFTYMLVFMFLPIISFFFRKDEKQYDMPGMQIVYGILFALIMIPYPFPLLESVNKVLSDERLQYPVSLGQIIVYISLILIAGMIIIENVIVNRRKNSLCSE